MNTHISRLTEYAFLWELQTLLPVMCCIYTPLDNCKQVGKLRFERSSWKLLPHANYDSPSYRMQDIQMKKVSRRHRQVALRQNWQSRLNYNHKFDQLLPQTVLV